MSEGIHPALIGLLRELPKPGASFKRKAEFINAFAQILTAIYPEPPPPEEDHVPLAK